MVITTLYKRHSTQGVQFQTTDSKEITTIMQLSAQVKEIKIIIHEQEKTTTMMMMMIDVPSAET